ncbi:Uncharacterised protein [Aedoeadaptatus ivorii]|uniref:Signal peptidase I n=1 Tax=Aedoeadaptatus ivorii TaxID=54006 RepID=A0A3S5BVX8_9FIRM|nr:DUF5684 domain-containing protein [Peptoniphilus ivorii]VEJ34983.1 Uncharacterised protein [Peptoniphilus ivorii]
MDYYENLLGLFAGGTAMMIALIVAIIYMVAWWKLFEKAGEAGIASIIPIYNTVVLARIVYGSGWFALLLLLPGIGAVYVPITTFLLMRRFDRSVLFSFLAIWIPFLVLVPAFGDDLYLGPIR